MHEVQNRLQGCALVAASLHSVRFRAGFSFKIVLFLSNPRNILFKIHLISSNPSSNPGVREGDSGAEPDAVEISYFLDPYTIQSSSSAAEYSWITGSIFGVRVGDAVDDLSRGGLPRRGGLSRAMLCLAIKSKVCECASIWCTR
ncbi:hypothetical protein SDC9_50302 [bioreactor metagenome]|uniref:Uncharacterized protein n=1 Tax=bioreactor metagenome TaxID=1076179 RepID=A0A644WJG4_9ZZZZ